MQSIDTDRIILQPFDERRLARDLRAALAAIGNLPLLLHIDLWRVGGVTQGMDRNSLLTFYQKLLEEELFPRPLLIPTFNYDFLRDGLYDVVKSPSQVGALTDHYRRLFPENRSLTPVFHFCLLHNSSFDLSPQSNCFDEASLFGQLANTDGAVLFFGAPLSTTTFIHHLEERCNISYRYHKHFSGTVITPKGSFPHTLTYRVRDLNSPLSYDWEKIERYLKEEGILQEYPLGKGRLLFYRCQPFLRSMMAKIAQEERFLLIS